ncbi:hypothetical protein [Mangrovibacter yixingensis]|nr:hypothetical protein [Mangrovibacter yixingensis]
MKKCVMILCAVLAVASLSGCVPWWGPGPGGPGGGGGPGMMGGGPRG